MDFYDAPPGYSDPNTPEGYSDVPDGYSDPSASKPKGKLQQFWDSVKSYKDNHEKKSAEMRKKFFDSPLKTVAQEIGNLGVGGIPTVDQLRRFGYIPDAKLPAEDYVPTPTIGRTIKGAVDLPVGLAQTASHVTGVGTKEVDAGVNAYRDFADANLDKSGSGEVLGQVLPFVASGGLSGLARGASLAPRALATAADFVAPVVATPEYGDDAKNFVSSKAKKAGIALLAGGAAKGVAGAIRGGVKGAKWVGKKLGSAPAVDEYLAAKEGAVGAGTPGERLQAILRKRYEQPLAQHDEIMASIADDAKVKTTDYKNTIATLDEIIDDYNANPSQSRPEEIDQLIALRNRLAKASAPPTESKVIDSVGSYTGGSGASPVGTQVIDNTGGISNDLAGLIRAYQDLGKPLGKNISRHGDRLSRGVVQDVRAAMLDDAAAADEGIASSWGQAREIFSNDVASQFDKRRGGDILRKLRDTADPDDELKKLLQGGLRDAWRNKLSRVVGEDAADPILWQSVKNALDQSNGRPGSFAGSLNKAVTALDGVAPAGDVEALKNMVFAARTGQIGGHVADAGVAGALSTIPVVGPTLATGTLLASKFAPAQTGQGAVWRAVQNPSVRKLFSKMSGIPETSAEFNTKLAQFIAQKAGGSQQ